MNTVYQGAKALAASSLLVAGSLAAADAPPFSVDDMLRWERFGRVLFDPEGKALVYELHRPFGEQPEFARFDLYRPAIFQARSGAWRDSRPINDVESDGYHLLGLSPDGTWLAYRRAFEDGELIGVLNLSDGRRREFDHPPEYFHTATWLDGALVFPARPEGQLRFVYAMRAERLRALAGKWEDARAGTVSTESVLTSGRPGPDRTGADFLVRVEPDSGQAGKLADGRFTSLIPSPDGTRLAMLKERRLRLDGEPRIEHGVNTGAVGHELVIAPARVVGEDMLGFPCERCDVLPGSLRWSPSGRKLSFVARMEGADWGGAAHFVYDASAGTAEQVPLEGLAPFALRDTARDTFSLPTAWFGRRLAILGIPRDSAADDEMVLESNRSRPDWFLLGGVQPVRLTREFEDGIPQVIAVYEFGGVFTHSGRAWLVDTGGRRRDLVPEHAAAIRAWSGDRDPAANAPSDTTLVLESQQGDAGPQLHFVEVVSGRVDTLTAPPHARFVAASANAGIAAVVETVGNRSMLSILQVDGASHRVAEINGHLDGVIGGRPVRVDHRAPDGSSRYSWLLLPPGYDGGQRLATVVNVYPGRVGGSTYRFWTPDQASALNDHLLAGRGYAVLYPSLPIDEADRLHDPLDGLAEHVFAAVDAAVAMGHVDADRLAVQGQSYGGYAVAGLIGQTDRFKAAVASAGFYNLISFYGVFDPRAWQDVESRGLRMFGASWLESGLGRIGAPPWSAPERYLRNSPLMLVENVTTPLMLIHGDRDFVSITQAEEYFTALSRLNKPAQFVRYFGEDHVPNSPANIRDMWERIFAWYEQHLGAPYAAPGHDLTGGAPATDRKAHAYQSLQHEEQTP